MAIVTCPPEDRLRSLLNGTLPADARAAVAQHVEQCAQRAGAIARLRGTSSAATLPPRPMDKLSNILTSSSAVDATLPPRESGQATGEICESDVNLSFLAPPQQPDELGRLGAYRVLKVLGQGGMGMVLQAEDPRLGRMCALKVMLPEVASRPEMKERFLREARAAAQIEHDHIIPIYQVDEDRGVPYIAMPYLKGSSLEDWLAKKSTGRDPATVVQILKLGREMAKGLGAAHERGLIHRDIKPANVWLDATAGGRVKILDFGLARATNPDGAASDKKLTKAGMILGTPAYMAPEQAQGQMDKVDGRADLFALGCIMYRLCTGSPPFKGDDMISTLVSVAMDTPPPPSQINAKIPPAVSDLVMRLMAKKPNERPASAKDVVKAIQTIEKELQAGRATTAEPPPVMPEPRPMPTGRSSRAPSGSKRYLIFGIAVGVSAFVLLFAGIVIYWESSNGTVRIEINDPNIKVAVDQGEFKIQGADKHDVSLKPGDHGLRVKYGDLEFGTDKFVLQKGDTVTLKVELLAGKVQVMQNGKPIGGGDLKPGGMAAQGNPSPPAVNPPTTQPAAAAPSQPAIPSPVPAGLYPIIDLLKRIDPQADAVKGSWERKGNDLVGHGGTVRGDLAILELPYRPAEEFDLVAELTRTDGANSFSFIVSRGNHSVEWATSMLPGPRTGFLLVDGKHLVKIPSSVRPDVTYTNGTRYAFRIEVRKSGVTAIVDGKKVNELKTDFSNLSLPAPIRLRGTTPLALGVGPDATVAFHRVEVVEVGGPGTPTRNLPQPAGTEPLPARFANELGMEFVTVPKGKAWLGGGGGTPGNRPVECARDFYLGKYEVTQDEWERVTGKRPSLFSSTGAGKDAVAGVPAADLKRFPVENVSWDEARAFVAKLNERMKASGWTYRLPRADEWEYACRGGPYCTRAESGFDYYFAAPTNQLRPDQANYGLPAEDKNRKFFRTCKVGSYPPNRLGLHDMHGNVWEWCEDERPQPNNTPGQLDIGGSWFAGPEYCRAGLRSGDAPSRKSPNIGLRVAYVPTDGTTVAMAGDKSPNEVRRFEPLFALREAASGSKRGWTNGR